MKISGMVILIPSYRPNQGLAGFVRQLTRSGAMEVYWAKILAEAVLFFANFVVQRDFVFPRMPGPTGGQSEAGRAGKLGDMRWTDP